MIREIEETERQSVAPHNHSTTAGSFRWSS